MMNIETNVTPIKVELLHTEISHLSNWYFDNLTSYIHVLFYKNLLVPFKDSDIPLT